MPPMSHPNAPSDVHILVIDSDAALQDAAAGAAGRLGIFQILCVSTPAEAINKMDRFQPNIILAEPMLGGAATLNFVRRVRAGQTSLKPDCLVLFASRDWTGGIAEKLCEIGCHGLIRKPCDEDKLQRALLLCLRAPVPFVAGVNYIGPDRRTPDGSKNKPPKEFRRTPSKGGWSAAIPYVKRSPPAAFAGIKLPPARPKLEGGKVEAGPVATPAPKPERVKYDLVEAPKEREDFQLVDDAPPAPAALPEETFDLTATVGAHLQWITTNGAEGMRANLESRSLVGAALGGQNLAKANMRGADLTNANLSKAILVDADLRNCQLTSANLTEAEMAGAKVRHAELLGAQMLSCGLQGADLAGADLRGAKLTGADFAGANLLGTDVRGADLVGLNLTQKQLDRARGDNTTRLPPGFAVGRGQASEQA
jgi:uncharacterized protein YjbI with pentapeptide repeats/CheY-like chemotaxis protein